MTNRQHPQATQDATDTSPEVVAVQERIAALVPALRFAELEDSLLAEAVATAARRCLVERHAAAAAARDHAVDEAAATGATDDHTLAAIGGHATRAGVLEVILARTPPPAGVPAHLENEARSAAIRHAGAVPVVALTTPSIVKELASFAEYAKPGAEPPMHGRTDQADRDLFAELAPLSAALTAEIAAWRSMALSVPILDALTGAGQLHARAVELAERLDVANRVFAAADARRQREGLTWTLRNEDGRDILDHADDVRRAVVTR